MQLSEYVTYDALGLAELVKSKQVEAKDLAGCALEAVDVVNPDLNAVIEVFKDRAALPTMSSTSESTFLGVPTLNKDLSFAEAGVKQEMGSNFTFGFVPATDSTTVERLRASGLNILGRTATPEFGNAGLTESLIAGITRNPWDVARTPGGSSGGSAGVVAARVVPVATASDGGGSTRTPASLCGLVGLKASRGLIPVGPGRGEGGSGLVGPFAVTRTMRDCAALLDVMGGSEPGDPYLVARPAKTYAALLDKPLYPRRIAYTDQCWSGTPTTEECRRALRDGLTVLEDAGHIIEEAMPVFDWDAFFNATITVMCSNLASGIDTLSEVFGRKPTGDDLQTSTWACYRYGKEKSATELLSALGQFNDVSRTFGRFLEEYDVLATPTNLFPAPKLADCYSCNPHAPITAAEYQNNVYSNDHYVAMANTTGQPSITIPSTPTDGGLPLGIQLIGRMGEDDVLLRLGRTLEQAAPWIDRMPVVNATC